MTTSSSNLFSFEFCEGQRKGSSLLYVPAEKQLYKLKSKDKYTKRYICYERNCKAAAVVDTKHQNKQKCRILQGTLHRAHQTQEQVRAQLKFLSAIKAESAKPVLARTHLRDAFNEQRLKDKETAHHFLFPRLQRQLLNIRNKSFPKDPQTNQDVAKLFTKKNIMDKFGKSRSEFKEPFYSNTIIEDSFSYTVFMSPIISQTIDALPPSVSRRYILDTSFHVPSSSYRIFLIIHFEYNMEQIFPFIYVLMSERTEAAYSHVFRYIDERIIKLFPYCFAYDNDTELKCSIDNVFPLALHGNYWFHYCQAVRMKAKQISNFQQTVRRNNNARIIFQKFLALPLVRRSRIGEAFTFLRSDINCVQNLRNDGQMFKTFIGYVQRQWVQRETPHFDITLRAISISRQLEDYNTRLNRKLVKLNSFFKCVSLLLDEDTALSPKFVSLTNEYRQEPSQSSSKPNNASYRIALAAVTLRKEDISIEDFFKEVTKRRNDLQPLLDEPFTYIEFDNDLEDNDIIEEQSILCVICFIRQRSVLLMPCRHIKLCRTCFDSMTANLKCSDKTISCPICREAVSNVIKVFC